MTRWHSHLLLLVSVVVVTSPLYLDTVHSETTATTISARQNQNYKKTVLTVGYLTAIKGELKDKQGLAISGALTMALDEVLFLLCFYLTLIYLFGFIAFLLCLFT